MPPIDYFQTIYRVISRFLIVLRVFMKQACSYTETKFSKAADNNIVG